MIEVVKAGLFTTVQDLGRFGYRKMGVPVSGAMDAVSAFMANSLLGNKNDRAVLEITLLGPTLKFHQETRIAIAGAPFEVWLNTIEIDLNQPILIHKNDVLTFGKAKKGMRCYLAVSGGLQTLKVLNSRSFYAGLTEEIKVKRGDLLPIETFAEIPALKSFSANASPIDATTLEVFPGPEYASLTIFEQQGIVEQRFTISAQSNRMAYLLECSGMLSAKEILTAPVQPGTVQLTPSGKLLVLMRDAQVTGGYARIFQLTEKSITILAQKRGGETIDFKLIGSPN
ncbi:biotin-dependent carboxyltransferase family protein [Rasiella sp. SM2506]|uniref:5-oxoprolinase subunit C family protein n=1 Tax=Rasiella sp. SM2506 TaxID=3423914 RepID=UPI003D7A3036